MGPIKESQNHNALQESVLTKDEISLLSSLRRLDDSTITETPMKDKAPDTTVLYITGQAAIYTELAARYLDQSAQRCVVPQDEERDGEWQIDDPRALRISRINRDIINNSELVDGYERYSEGAKSRATVEDPDASF